MDLSCLDELQDEITDWTGRNFGRQEAWKPLLGAVEELGELSHAHLKAAQGIRGTPEEHAAAKQDAVADCIIFLANYASASGFKLSKAIEAAWTEVKQRNFKEFPNNGRTK